MSATLSTTALVLHTTPWAETSVIAKIFTRQMGVRSYIIKGVRTAAGRTKQNLLQPLSHLDMVVYDNPHTRLNYIKEMALHIEDLPQEAFDRSLRPVQDALKFFMTEVLHKTLREAEPMPALFDYVARCVCFLTPPTLLAHLPVTYLLTVSEFLGIEPLDNYSAREPLFSLTEGRFCSSGEQTLDGPASALLHDYLLSLRSAQPCPAVPLAQRTELVNRLLDYYRIHLSDFRDFKSHEILHAVLE